MKEKHSNTWALVSLACTVLLIFIPNYAQYQLSPLAYLVMPAYDLDTVQFSMLFSAAMIAGVALSLVAGLLCDRFGVKRVVGIVGIVSVAAIIARIFASSFSGLFVCMALTGLLATFLNTNIAKIAGAWFDPEHVGLAVGVGLAGVTLSMAIGMGTSALFPSLETIFVFTAVIAVVALVAWWLFFRDGPRTAKPSSADTSDCSVAQPSLAQCLKVVSKSRNVWLIGVALGLDMTATMCILTFMPQVLQVMRGFDPAAAGALSSIVTFGNLAGSVLASVIMARVGRFKPVAIVLIIVAAAGTAFAWQLPTGPIMVVCFFFTGFALSGLLTVLVSAIVLLPEIGPVYAGTAGGVGATLQLFGAVVIPSYILVPILGANYPVLYGVSGILCLAAVACIIPLPEVLKQVKGE